MVFVESIKDTFNTLLHVSSFDNNKAQCYSPLQGLDHVSFADKARPVKVKELEGDLCLFCCERRC